MEKRTEREGGLPFPDSNGGMDLYGRRTQFEFDWGFCDTDINEVTRTRPVLRTRKKKKLHERSRTSFLSFDAATRPRTKAVPIRKDGYSIFSRHSAERRCIMAEACSPPPHLSSSSQLGSPLIRINHWWHSTIHKLAACSCTTQPFASTRRLRHFPARPSLTYCIVLHLSHSIVHLRYHVL